MKVNQLLIATLTLGLLASSAVAAEGLSSPRGADMESSRATANGYPGWHPFSFHGKAAKAGNPRVAGKTERDLVKESRSNVYTGKGAVRKPAAEPAPAQEAPSAIEELMETQKTKSPGRGSSR